VAEITVTEEMTPGEIVAVLHAAIAAQSPEQAALVAAFDQVPRTPPRPVRQPRAHAAYQPRYQRMLVYSKTRLAGQGVKAAAKITGLSYSSAGQYEADFLDALGGGM